jgi:amidase
MDQKSLERYCVVNGSFFVPHDLQAPMRGAATGLLAGLTVVVKDMYDIVGSRTGGGSPEWLAEQKPATRNAAVVEQILAAGAIITGKTICDEFFYSVTGVNAHYGTPRNLRAPGRLPGGSSSGSAAACGANACDFAIGSDTGGSVRIPASFNGLYGLRPTHGRIDLAGAMAMAPSFDVGGWFASAPGIFQRVGTVLLRGDRITRRVEHLLLAGDAFAQADTAVADLGRRFLRRASSVLPQATEMAVALDGFDEWREAFRIVQAKEVWETFGAFIARARPKLGPGIRERMEFAAAVTAQQADAARNCHLVPCSFPRAPAARHCYGAANSTIHCAAGKYRRGGSRIVSSTCDAADLHGWPSRFATDKLARGNGIRLPGRTFTDWLAQW